MGKSVAIVGVESDGRGGLIVALLDGPQGGDEAGAAAGQFAHDLAAGDAK